MEKSSKRGKIPQQDWPSIMTRYEAGETLASIARTYDCSPPAISYIVARSRARDAAAEAAAHTPPPSSEPQLVKGHPAETPAGETPQANLSASPTPASEVPSAAPRPIERSRSESERDEPRLFPDEATRTPNPGRGRPLREGNGLEERYGQGERGAHWAGNGNTGRSFGPAAAPPQDSESRRTLHLSLPHSGNDGPQDPDPRPQQAQITNTPDSGERFAPRPAVGEQGFAQPSRPASGHYPPPDNGAPVRMLKEPQRSKEGAAFIDQALRERVDGDIAAFLAAFDAALAHDTPESRAGLREATDRLLRAGARTRIELERLEARVPLPPREKTEHTAPAWRQR